MEHLFHYSSIVVSIYAEIPMLQSNPQILIIALSCIACIFIYVYCSITHIRLIEIEEYYACQQRHKILHYVFKICVAVILISLSFNIKFIVVQLAKRSFALIKVGKTPK